MLDAMFGRGSFFGRGRSSLPEPKLTQMYFAYWLYWQLALKGLLRKPPQPVFEAEKTIDDRRRARSGRKWQCLPLKTKLIRPRQIGIPLAPPRNVWWHLALIWEIPQRPCRWPVTPCMAPDGKRFK
jgi:hypothetical protein